MDHGVYSQADFDFWVLSSRAYFLLKGESSTLKGDIKHWKTSCCSKLPSKQEHIIKSNSASAPEITQAGSIAFSKSYWFCQASCPVFAYPDISNVLKIKKYKVEVFPILESNYKQTTFSLQTHSTFMGRSRDRQRTPWLITAKVEVSWSARENHLCVSMLCLNVWEGLEDFLDAFMVLGDKLNLQ